MSPLIRVPSRQVVTLAEALVRDPATLPVVENPTLQTAVRRVRNGFDSIDNMLLARAVEEGNTAGLVQRVAQEIASEEMRVSVMGLPRDLELFH